MTQFGQNEYVNPVSVYIQFKGGGEGDLKGKFYTWDKELSQDVEVDLGEFIILKTAYTVRGYSDKYEAGIYSNTVEYLNQELQVKTHKSKKTDKQFDLAVGLYKEIKGDILGSGAKLFGVYYILLSDSRIAYLSIKGSAWMGLSEIMKVYTMNKYKFKVSEIKEGKKGATTYVYPIFGQGAPITEDEEQIALSKLELLNQNKKEEIKETENKEEQTSIVDELLAEIKDDDLPF